MPNAPRTQHRSVRIADNDWADLRAAAEILDSDRGTVIKDFVRWYLRRPGAKPVQRPDAGTWTPIAEREEPAS